MIRVRFAPSPTGSPHIGNIRTAIFDWLYARHTGGKFVLRIEDTDQARYVEGALEEMMNDLRWMGMQWDEGPEVGGDFGPYFQSERLDIYHKYAGELIAAGKAYKCYCTSERLTEMREAQQAAGKTTGYDRRCRSLSEAELESSGKPYVVRFAMPESGTSSYQDVVRGSELSFDNSLQDDFVMLKSDGFPTYNFASVVDDHLMEISHVFRGEEYISSMPKYIYLYEALGWEQPVWVHVPLILGPDKSKLSKRHGAVNFSSYIGEGYLPEAMINFLALLGWSDSGDKDLYTIDELVERFDISGIINHPAIFDSSKLLWMNGVYIRQKSIDELLALCLPYLQEVGLVPENPDEPTLTYTKKVLALIHDRLKLLSEAPEMSEFFFKDDLTFEQKGVDKWLAKPETPAVLEHVAERIESLGDWSVEAIEATVREAGVEAGAEGGKVIHPVRVSVTGRTTGPGLFETMEALGREKVVQRLRNAAGRA